MSSQVSAIDSRLKFTCSGMIWCSLHIFLRFVDPLERAGLGGEDSAVKTGIVDANTGGAVPPAGPLIRRLSAMAGCHELSTFIEARTRSRFWNEKIRR